MKRTLVVAGLIAVAGFAPASPAQADHVCVYSQGRPVACSPHPDWIILDRTCVTSGGQTVVCVP